MSEYKTSTPNFKARALLAEKKFTVKDTGISYRELNHWTEIGLIDDAREGNSGWRKLSVVDLLWIRIIQTLREFGLSLEKLEMVRCYLFEDELPGRKLESAIGACMAYVPMFIMVYKDGTAEIQSGLWVEEIDADDGYPTYIRLNLNRIWYELTGESTKPYFRKISERLNNKRYPQSEAEAHVIDLMRNEFAQEITINRPSSKAGFQVNTSRRVEGAQQVAQMLKELHYGELQIHVENGKPVASKITKKKKITK